jgi:hypothetical protein
MARRRRAKGSHPDPPARRTLPRALELLPVWLLLAVALNQIRLAYTEALPSWSGGGFGMFASTDVWGRRHLHVWVMGEGDDRREVDLQSVPGVRELDPQIRVLLGHPTKERLRELALRIARMPLRDPGPIEGIAIAVFAVDYAPDTLEPSGELVRGIEVRLDDR